jgi:3-dehydrotetronate 4-kinase
MNKPLLGCIADDLTGATDLANNLARAGMRAVLTIDTPAHGEAIDADAIVVALKTRTIPAAEAVAQSLQSCRWLRSRGVRQIYFKICSTFDSTPQGNIGPVIEALMNELDCDFSVVIPAFPDNNRTVFRGHLFVGDVLLSDSGMRNHPLTPMTDSNLVRFLQTQLCGSNHYKVGLIDYRTVAQSASVIRQRINELRAEGTSIAIADTISNDDLENLATALRDDLFVTAGSGLGISLPAVWGFVRSQQSGDLPRAGGCKAVISGSCSTATNVQVQHFVDCGGSAHRLDLAELASDIGAQVEHALAWADSCWRRDPVSPVLIYSTAQPHAVDAMQVRLGVEKSAKLVEDALSAIASGLVARGAGQLIVAGGETSGVCVRALDIQQMQIGPQIDPGVPWCFAASCCGTTRGLHIALKSGNFGSHDFFTKAFTVLE